MIVTLNDTTASKIGATIVEARRTVGSGSGLVHTLICVCDSSDFDAAFDAARDAARQHPSRLLMVVTTRSARTSSTPRYTLARELPARSSCCGSPEPWPSDRPRSSFRCCYRTPPSSPGGPSRVPTISPLIPSGPWLTAASLIRPLTRIPAGRWHDVPPICRQAILTSAGLARRDGGRWLPLLWISIPLPSGLPGWNRPSITHRPCC